MDLVTRYIAAVQRELPEDKRDEIGREMNANIRDQLDALTEQKGELSDDDSAAVLAEYFTDLGTYAFLLVMIWYPLWFTPEQLEAQRISLAEPARQFLTWCTPVLLAGIVLNIGQLKQRFWNRPLLIANVALNSALVLILLYLAVSGPLLEINMAALPYVFEWDSLQRTIVVTLLITACFPGYELVRDLLRLKRLARA